MPAGARIAFPHRYVDPRRVDADEVGGPPDPSRGGGLPITLIRNGTRVSFDDDAFQRVEAGDIVVSLSGRR